MRVLLLSQSYPPRQGGLERVVQTLAVRMAQRGHEVRVMAQRYPRRLPVREVRDGIGVERALFLSPRVELLRRARPDLWLASLFHRPATAARLRQVMETFRPDVVNLHFPDLMVPFVLRLRRRYRFRLVVSLHGNDVTRFATQAHGLREIKVLFRQADAVTACSRHLLELAIRLEPAVAAKGVAIYNGIDPSRFDDKTIYQHDRPYILALGRFTPVKGFDLLLRAFARLGTCRPDISLILAGDGEMRQDLVELAHDLGVSARVCFLGMVPPAQAVRLMNGCLLTAVPSRDEAFGLVALEALAAARPVLATRVGGMAEFLQGLLAALPPAAPGRGPVVLVEPTVEGLAEGLHTCLHQDWSVGLGETVRARVMQECSWDRTVQRYDEILRKDGSRTCGIPG